jgi:integrase/recombinase XerD
MKPTLKMMLVTRRPKQTGKYPVKLQITFQRKTKQYLVGIDLSTDEFEYVLNPSKNKELFDAKTKRDLSEDRLTMNALLGKANDIITKLVDFSFAQFDKKFYQKKLANTDVYQYYESAIQRFKEKERFGTASCYQSSLTSLKTFRPHLSFRDITVDFLEEYEAWFLGKGKSISTVGIYLRPLRAIINEAIEDGIISKENNYPFGKRRYQIPASKNIKKALTLEEISRYFRYDAPPDTWHDKARDFFLFSYLGNGINMKDISLLKNKDLDGDYIRFIRAKTQHTNRSSSTQISIYIVPEMKAIIEKWRGINRKPESYLFPILDTGLSIERQGELVKLFTRNMNTYLKYVTTAIGIDKPVTTYFARHSFATILRRSGATTEMISESLGHTSTKTTVSYLDSFEDDKRKEIMAALTNF